MCIAETVSKPQLALKKKKCTDQSQCPVLTPGESSTSQRQPSAAPLCGRRRRTLGASPHQRGRHHAETRDAGEPAGVRLCPIHIQTRFLVVECKSLVCVLQIFFWPWHPHDSAPVLYYSNDESKVRLTCSVSPPNLTPSTQERKQKLC